MISKLLDNKYYFYIHAFLRCLQMRIFDKFIQFLALTYGYLKASKSIKKIHHLQSLSKNDTFVWVGNNYEQDFSGIVDGLSRTCNVVIYNHPKSDYGTLRKTNNIKDPINIKNSNGLELIHFLISNFSNLKNITLIGQFGSHLFNDFDFVILQKLGCKVIQVSMDDRLPTIWFKNGYKSFFNKSRYFSLNLTTCNDLIKRYESIGQKAIYFPLASSQKTFYPLISPKLFDIVFIGSNYGQRTLLINHLLSKGFNISCYGHGWPNGFVSADETNKLMSKAKIVLGHSGVGYCANYTTLKLRDFDSIISGAFYITQRNNELLNHFVEGLHFECYSSFEELCNKINYYLVNEKDRERIASQGRVHALKFHTWDRRWSTLFGK